MIRAPTIIIQHIPTTIIANFDATSRGALPSRPPPPSLPNHILRCGSSCWQGDMRRIVWSADAVSSRSSQRPQQSPQPQPHSHSHCSCVTRAVVRDSRELVRQICWTGSVAFRGASAMVGSTLAPFAGRGSSGGWWQMCSCIQPHPPVVASLSRASAARRVGAVCTNHYALLVKPPQW